jgi:hypothetical protein
MNSKNASKKKPKTPSEWRKMRLECKKKARKTLDALRAQSGKKMDLYDLQKLIK